MNPREETVLLNIPPTQKRLRPKHRLFVEEYLRTWNGTEAYKAAYPRAKRETARVNASVLLTNPNIKAEIDRRITERAMSADEVLDRLGRQARGSHEPWIHINDDGFIYFDFSDPEAQKHLDLIKKIKTKRTRRIEGRGNGAEEWEDEFVEVELYDSQAALALLGKHLQLFNERMDFKGDITLRVIRDMESGSRIPDPSTNTAHETSGNQGKPG